MKVDESINFIDSQLMNLKQAQPHRKCSRFMCSFKILLIWGKICIFAKSQILGQKGLEKRRQSHPYMEAYLPAQRESASFQCERSLTTSAHTFIADIMALFLANQIELQPVYLIAHGRFSSWLNLHNFFTDF